ncbi:MAG: hypothetical protein ACLRQF_01405 [Thomasclavelia ramosa]
MKDTIAFGDKMNDFQMIRGCLWSSIVFSS